MADHRLALIVGANRGIGLGVAKQFLAHGWDLIATARQPDKATSLQALAASHPGRVSIPQLDIDNAAALDAFAATLGDKPLDAVLVNAGVSGPDHRSANAVTPSEIGALMFTNAIAPVRLARSLVGHVRRGSGVVAFTSSIMGSVAANPGGHELYRASKAALNSLCRGLWGEWSGKHLTMLSLHPGWVRTDMGGPNAPLSPEESIAGMRQVIAGLTLEDSGRFLNYDGTPVSW